MLLLTINRWIVAFLGFSFECGITLQIKLPGGAFQSLVPRCQQFSALRPGCASSAPPGGRPDLPESPVQEQNLPQTPYKAKHLKIVLFCEAGRKRAPEEFQCLGVVKWEWFGGVKAWCQAQRPRAVSAPGLDAGTAFAG